MAQKLGNGGAGNENYDPQTGRYVSEKNKIANSMGLNETDIKSLEDLDNLYLGDNVSDDMYWQTVEKYYGDYAEGKISFEDLKQSVNQELSNYQEEQPDTNDYFDEDKADEQRHGGF